MKKILDKALALIFKEKWKKYSELRYWKKQKLVEETLSNSHYKYSYTEHFGLSEDYYSGKKILDIGCGPRGSLEWAESASERVGIDPLADEYLRLGANQHSMRYVSSPSEEMPLESSYFDIVCSFNSLDHVNSIEKTVSEIKRVTKKGGIFLLLVEINHDPTSCEPHKIEPSFYKSLLPEFNMVELRFYDALPKGLYASLLVKPIEYQSISEITQVCWMSVMFSRS